MSLSELEGNEDLYWICQSQEKEEAKIQNQLHMLKLYSIHDERRNK